MCSTCVLYTTLNRRALQNVYSPRFAWGGRPHRRFILDRHTYIHTHKTHTHTHTYIYIYIHMRFCDNVFLFFSWSSAASQLKHRYKKSFQNIVFHTLFTMFPVKNTVIYTFFAIKSVQNTSFCCVFNGLASKHLSNNTLQTTCCPNFPLGCFQAVFVSLFPRVVVSQGRRFQIFPSRGGFPSKGISNIYSLISSNP